MVEDGPLARSYRTLRSVKGNLRCGCVDGLDRCGGGLVLVPDFHRSTNGPSGLFDRNPIRTLDFKRSRAKGIVITDDDALFLRVDGKHVERFACCKTKPFALTDLEIVDSLAAAESTYSGLPAAKPTPLRGPIVKLWTPWGRPTTAPSSVTISPSASGK